MSDWNKCYETGAWRKGTITTIREDWATDKNAVKAGKPVFVV